MSKTYDSILDLIDKIRDLDLIGSELCNVLYEKVSDADNKKERRILIEAKRNIYNKRDIFDEKYKIIKKYCTVKEINLLNKFINLSQDISRIESKITNLFDNELKLARNNLRELTKKENFKNGLLLSSSEFFNLIKKRYWKINNSNRNNSYNSIEYGIAKYISRMYAKTSPFSAFTHLGFGEIKFDLNLNKNIVSPTNKIKKDQIVSSIRTNQYLYKYLYILLSEIPSFVEQFNLNLNPTINLTNNSIHYFTNKGNTESIQTISSNETLLAIYGHMQKGESKFYDLEKFLLNKSNYDKNEVQVFIKRLVKIGFLDYNIGNIQGTDPNWYIKLQSWLESIEQKSPLKRRLIKTLKNIETSINLYQESDNKKREKLLVKIFKEYKFTCNKLKKSTSLNTFPNEVDNIKNTETTFYEYKTAKRFPFEEHQILYEDTKYTVFSEMDRNICEDIVQLLDKFISWLIPYEGHSTDKNNITEFFIEKYGKDQEVDFLSFYESYQKAKTDFSNNSTIDRDLAQFFYKKFKPIGNDHISIGYELFTEEVEKKMKYDSRKPNSFSSHSAFLQFFKENNRAYAVVNGIYPGFGKMFSRFLYLQDNLINSLRDENISYMEDAIGAEDSDSSFFNANIHPPLMPFEITFPGSHNVLPKEKRIPITNLSVKYDDNKGRIHIFDKSRKKTIYIFDLCFQSQSGRSDLYQFLERFTLEQYFSANSLFIREKTVVQQKLKEQRDSNNFKILKIPRVDIDSKLIIQRKSWFIPKQLLPIKKNNESQSSFFIRVNEWRIKNNLTKDLFIYLVYPQERVELDKEILNKLGNNAYKPQYISFDNPFFVEIFSSICKKVPRTLKITEMLPSRNQLLQYGKEKRVSEFIVQWSSKNNI